MMDPQLALYPFLAALEEDDRETADEYHGHLTEWLNKGGCEPEWDATDRRTFFAYRAEDGYPDERTDEDLLLSTE